MHTARPALNRADVQLLAAWSAIGLGAAISDGAYTTPSIYLVALGTGLLVWTLAQKSDATDEPDGAGYLLAGGAALFAALVIPAGIYGSGRDFYLSHALTAIAALAIATSALFMPQRSSRLVFVGAIGVMFASSISLVLSSPKPSIDVWYMMQAATQALWHGHNIYAITWTSGLPGEVSNKFVYLPGSAVLLVPFHALFGDIRYGLLTANTVVGIMLFRLNKDSGKAIIGPLYLLYPLALFGIEQSWIDPLVLFAFAAMGYAIIRGHSAWAVLAFAVALTCKQQAWLAIPFAIFWKDFGWRRVVIAVSGATAFILPWIVANTSKFTLGAITYNLRLHPLLSSLSIYTTLLIHGKNPSLGLLVVATAGVMLLGWWRSARSTYGFFIGTATVEAIFNLTNKQSFYNEWELAAGLAILAVAFHHVPAFSESSAGAKGDAPCESVLVADKPPLVAASSLLEVDDMIAISVGGPPC